MWSFFFGSKQSKDPKELVRDLQSSLRKEHRQLDRQIHSIQLEDAKTKRMLKESVRKGEHASCRLLAKEIVKARKAIARIHTSKAKLMSVECHLSHQLATLRLSGSMKTSAEVMKTMQELVKVSDISESMRDLSSEMMKAGVIEEMVDDMFEDALGDEEDLDEDVQEEVESVLWDMTGGELGRAPAVASGSLSTEVEEGDIMERLEALRS